MADCAHVVALAGPGAQNADALAAALSLAFRARAEAGAAVHFAAHRGGLASGGASVITRYVAGGRARSIVHGLAAELGAGGEIGGEEVRPRGACVEPHRRGGRLRHHLCAQKTRTQEYDTDDYGLA